MTRNVQNVYDITKNQFDNKAELETVAYFDGESVSGF